MSNQSNTPPGDSISVGDVSGTILGAVNVGKNINNILVGVTSSINSLPDSERGKTGIKKALNELKEAITKDPNLTEKRKKEALQKLEDLAKAAKNSNPKAEEPREDANFALNLLKSMTETLGNATQFAKIFNEVLPAIKLWFGLP